MNTDMITSRGYTIIAIATVIGVIAILLAK